MAPASFRTSHFNLRIAVQLGEWAERNGTGLATESSGGFVLPNSAVYAPDAAWVRRDRLDAVPSERQHRFLPLCPDFAIELLSPTDTLGRVQAKLHEYIDNGLRLGWLIDLFERRVHVYRPRRRRRDTRRPPQRRWRPRSSRISPRSRPSLVGGRAHWLSPS